MYQDNNILWKMMMLNIWNFSKFETEEAFEKVIHFIWRCKLAGVKSRKYDKLELFKKKSAVWASDSKSEAFQL